MVIVLVIFIVVVVVVVLLVSVGGVAMVVVVFGALEVFVVVLACLTGLSQMAGPPASRKASYNSFRRPSAGHASTCLLGT